MTNEQSQKMRDKFISYVKESRSVPLTTYSITGEFSNERTKAAFEAYQAAYKDCLSEFEQVGKVVGWEDEDGNIPVKWSDVPTVEAELFARKGSV